MIDFAGHDLRPPGGATGGQAQVELIHHDGRQGLEAADLLPVDPSGPSVVSYYDTAGKTEDVLPSGSTLYVADGDLGGLVILDMTDMYRMSLLGSYDTAGYTVGVQGAGNYILAADMNEGLVLLDVRTPSAPQETGLYPTTGFSNGVFLAGSLAFVAEGEAGLSIYAFCVPAL